MAEGKITVKFEASGGDEVASEMERVRAAAERTEAIRAGGGAEKEAEAAKRAAAAAEKSAEAERAAADAAGRKAEAEARAAAAASDAANAAERHADASRSSTAPQAAPRSSSSAEAVAGTFVVSKQAAEIAKSGQDFQKGMLVGSAALNLASRTMGSASGTLGRVAASLGNLGSIAGGLGLSGGIAGALGTAGLVGSVGIASVGVGQWLGNKVFGDWLGWGGPSEEELAKIAALREKNRVRNEGRFSDESFARELGGMTTSAETGAALKALEDEKWQRERRRDIGLDDTAENADALARLDERIAAAKKKNAELVEQENAERERARAKTLNDEMSAALKAQEADAWEARFDEAGNDEKLAMLSERKAAANARSTREAGNAEYAETDEAFEAAVAAMREANAEALEMEKRIRAVTKEQTREADAEKKRSEAESEKKATESAREANAMSAYSSNGNSLARVGLMASSPAARAIEITAEHTKKVAENTSRIADNTRRASVAVAG